MTVSRILLHVPAADVEPTVAVLAAQGTVTVAGCRIEVTDGTTAAAGGAVRRAMDAVEIKSGPVAVTLRERV